MEASDQQGALMRKFRKLKRNKKPLYQKSFQFMNLLTSVLES